MQNIDSSHPRPCCENAKVYEHDGVFPHPMPGPMTKLEWIYFTLAHTERHLFQIKDAVALVKSGINRQD